MIQRTQTLYLFFVIILNGILPFLTSLKTLREERRIRWHSDTLLGRILSAIPDFMDFGLLFWNFMYIISSFLAFRTILYYKKRSKQFALNKLNIIFNLLLLGYSIEQWRTIFSGYTDFYERGIGILLPIVISILFLLLAGRAIKRDELLNCGLVQ